MAKKGNSSLRKGVYAGSFDPVTKGHLGIIFEAARLMDTLYVVVGVNPMKAPLFTPEERVAMIERDIRDEVRPKLKADGIDCGIKVTQHTGLTAHFMKAHDAPFYIRGLRMGTEFDAEHAAMTAGRGEYPAFTSVFLTLADGTLQATSSSLVRELEMFGGNSVGKYVTPQVEARLKARIAERGLRIKP